MARLVRTNYAVRAAAFLYCLIVIGLHLWVNGAGPLAWVLLVLQFAVYPHLAYLRAARAPDPRRAELDNLLLDSTLLGAWMAGLGFPTSIALGLTGATVLNAAVNRGTRGALASLACTGAGAALALALGGFDYAPATGTLVTALAFAGSLWYTVLVGTVVYVQQRRLLAAREALRAGEERYRFIAEHAGDLISLVDGEARWLYCSPSYARVLHADDLEPGVDAFRRVHPDDADRARLAVLRAASTGQQRELPLRLVDLEGRIRQYKMRVQPVGHDEPGRKIKALVLVSQDVTDLRESEERLLLAAHALEGMTEAIMIAAADGTIVTVNRAFTAITGYSRDDVLGNHEKAVRNALQPPEFFDELYAAVQREGYWSGSTWARRKNGSVYREWRSVRAVRDAQAAVTHYVMVFSEVGGAAGASRADEPAKA
jgi:PAS domain S-box-containing protein